MSDLIDRQAVIDLLKQMRKDGNMVPWEGKDVFARIRKLPTIQPEKAQLFQEGTTKDAISRQAAIDLFPNDVLEWDTLNGYIAPHVARRLIEQLPSAQPEPHEGYWIWVAGDLECSKCHTRYPDLYPDYADSVACPHCGVHMKGERRK